MATLTFQVDSVEEEDPWPVGLKLFETISSYLQPGSILSAHDTAEKLHALRPDVRPESESTGEEKEELNVFMWNFWVLFAEMAREIPYNHPSQERMLELAFALRDMPGSDWGGPGMSLHEWITVGPFDPYSSDPEGLVWKARKLNLFTFVARLTQARYGDYVYAAVWCLSAALESIPDPRARAWHTQGPALDAWMPIAAEWIQRTGDIILQNCRDEVSTNGPPFLKKKKGRVGFFMDRWQFWKEKFGQVSEMEQASAQTKDIAKNAQAKMLELENSNVKQA